MKKILNYAYDQFPALAIKLSTTAALALALPRKYDILLALFTLIHLIVDYVAYSKRSVNQAEN